MLLLSDLIEFARLQKSPPEKRRGVLREYLQTLMLFFIQQNSLAPKLVFIGGTALRFFYNLQRFSEDLDFNYLGVLKGKKLHELMEHLQKEFAQENIPMEYVIRKSKETYFHWKVYAQFPTVLHLYQCGSIQGGKLHRKEKLSIQLDFQNIGKNHYPLNKKIISHFGKRFLFNTTHLDMFLAEKSNAIFYRVPARGRDFFDFMSIILWGAEIEPSLMRMREIKVNNRSQYKAHIKKRIEQMDFVNLTRQLGPFLFNKEDIQIMSHFKLHIDNLLKKL